MDPILAFLNEQRPAMLDALERLVRIESPTQDAAAVNRAVDYVALLAGAIDGRITRHNKSREHGEHLQIDFGASGRGAKRTLLLGHLDTVWDIGTIAHMPFKIAQGRAWGPGVLDMKCGVVMMLFALRALRETGRALTRQVTLLLNSDEEVGSPSSRANTERIAKTCERVFVLEPGTGLTGKLKTARKGVGDYEVRVRGRGAHAGVDFTAGVSAINELAAQIPRIAAFTRLPKGLTVSVGVIGGGTRSNVIAEEAWAKVDIRVARLKDAPWLDAQFKKLRPIDKRTSLTISGGLNRPPMERTAGIVALFKHAQVLGCEVGLELEESMTGGGSDGNFTAALGIPTLDGLGGVGEGAHAANESILLAPLAARTALLAKLLA